MSRAPIMILSRPTIVDQYAAKLHADPSTKFPHHYVDPTQEFGGFRLSFQKSGGRVWQLLYRVKGAGWVNNKCLNLGDYRTMNYTQAVAAASEANALAKSGVDPMAAGEAKADAQTVRAMAERFFVEHVVAGGLVQKNFRQFLDNEILPALGDMVPAEVRDTDALRLIRGMAMGPRRNPDLAPAPGSADQCCAVLRKMFKWGKIEYSIRSNPCDGIPRFLPPRKDAGSIALHEKQISQLWHGLDATGASPQVRLYIKFLLVTAVRPNEAAAGRFDEIVQHDEIGPVWVIPGDRMKMSEPHAVPLSPIALKILEEAKRVGGGSAYFFPSPVERQNRERGDYPISTQAGRKLVSYPSIRETLGLLDRQTLYSLRKCGPNTLLRKKQPGSAMRYTRDHINYLLAHIQGGSTANYVGGVDERWDENLEDKQTMLNHWSEIVSEAIRPSLAIVATG